MNGINLTLSIYSSNLKSLKSIYLDSISVQKIKIDEYLKIRQNSSWSEEEFDDYSHYENHFEWLLLQALFVSGFSYFENFMKSIARQVEKEKNHNVKIKDLKGDGLIDVYRKYLFLIGEYKIASSDRKEWKNINDFKKLRNAIIHDYGIMNTKLEIIEKHKLAIGPSKKMIRIRNVDFLDDFILTATNYMEKIASEINSYSN
jgi:hypothetical protein